LEVFLKYFLYGYVGSKNFGDEFLTKKVIEDIKKIDKDANFFVWTLNEDFTKKFLKDEIVSTVKRFSVEDTIKAIESSDVVVLSGGGIVQEHHRINIENLFNSFGMGIVSYSIPPLIGKMLNKKIFYWSIGHGPVVSSLGINFAKWFYSLADVITVRDETSFDFIKNFNKNTFLDTDPLLDYEFKTDNQNVDENSLVFSIRNWFNDDNILRNSYKTIKLILEKYPNLKVNLLPFDLNLDVEVLTDLKKLFNDEIRVNLILTDDFQKVIDTVNQSKYFIGMRLHSLILAYKLKKIFIGISYDLKTENFLNKVNRPYIRIQNFNEHELYNLIVYTIEGKQIHRQVELPEYKTPKIFENFLKEEFPNVNTPLTNHNLDKIFIDPREVDYLVKSMVDKETELQFQNQQLIQKNQDLEQQNQQLLTNLNYLQTELNMIKDSDMWKIARWYYKLRDGNPITRNLHKTLMYSKKFYRKTKTEGLFKAIKLSYKYTYNIFINKMNKKSNIDKGELFIKEIARKKSLLYLSTIRWDSALFQRPQHISFNAAKKGVVSVYCEPPIYREPTFTYLSKNLILTNICEYFVDKITKSAVILPSTFNSYSIEDLMKMKKNSNIIIYDYIDEIDPDISGDITFSLERHKRISPENIDFVSVVSLKLYNEMIDKFPKERVIYLPNAVDFEHFNIERNYSNIPESMKSLINKPIIGYFGALASWLDYDLINYIAVSNPQWNIVLIGLDYDGSLKELKHLENIHYLGVVDYKELPKYAVWFDVAIIPFKEGNIAKATSPIKLYEYMALGKPVVFTKDLDECKLYKTPTMAENKEDFVEKLKLALELAKDPEFVKAIKEEAKQNTWESRVETLLKRINFS
jgi:polysaccharide pyruvyl transferase CsaB